jgi:hypothetical protein
MNKTDEFRSRLTEKYIVNEYNLLYLSLWMKISICWLEMCNPRAEANTLVTHWLHVTDEYMGQLAPPLAMAMWPLYSSVNRRTYGHYVRRLIDEHIDFLFLYILLVLAASSKGEAPK